jgi:predicted nucleic acid-binding protein
MLLVDSSVWIDYFNGVVTPQTDFLDGRLRQEEIVLGDLILCEVLQGFARQHDFDVARSALLKLPVLNMGGAAVALQAADNYRRLRRQGITVRKTIDCLIATFAIREGLPLLHSDRDFEPFVQYLELKSAM